MAQVIGVRFESTGKMYYFAPNNIKAEKGQQVIVETARGLECGDVCMGNSEIPDEETVSPLKKVVRIATNADFAKMEENKEKEKKAFAICEEKIALHKLDMKLIYVEYTFDCTKILFYFTSDGRVDFRDLVKDLASQFRTRIELRQIGVRDEAKLVGGRPLCCKQFLSGFQPVSIKMAKDQGLSLNPVKISGTCGRLMCCLKYEQDAYTDLLKTTPKHGAIVTTDEGKGTVIDLNILTSKLTIKLDKDPDAAPIVRKAYEVKVIKDGQIRLDKKEMQDLKKLEEK